MELDVFLMLSQARKISLAASALLYTSAGLLHFIKPRMYMRIVPPYFPWPGVLVAVSGVAEIAGAIGLLIPGLRRAAGWGLTALLIAVFPANLYMAQTGYPGIPKALLWARLPLQGVLIWWVLWTTA